MGSHSGPDGDGLPAREEHGRAAHDLGRDDDASAKVSVLDPVAASLSLPDFPDAWAYYRWFPAAGEVLFAWVMMPFRSDLLLGPFGVLVWLAVLITGARLARQLGADSRSAWLAGAALAALPTVTMFMTSNYVDNLPDSVRSARRHPCHRFLRGRRQSGMPVLSLGASPVSRSEPRPPHWSW